MMLSLLLSLLISLTPILLSPSPQKQEVKGVQTSKPSPTPTIQPTVLFTPTPTPKIQGTPLPTKSVPKQKGGWYWQPHLGKSLMWEGTDNQGKDIWSDGSPTPTPPSQQSGGSVKTVILNKTSGGGATIQSTTNGQTVIYVTPTPESGPFSGTFSYDSSNGSAKMVMNKEVQDCTGQQKDPANPSGGDIKSALRMIHGYVCELYFAPPNTPYYGGKIHAQVTATTGETKTFGDW